jgi:hypothetical protein
MNHTQNNLPKTEVKLYYFLFPALLLTVFWMLILCSQGKFGAFCQYMSRLGGTVIFVLSVISVAAPFLGKSLSKGIYAGEKILLFFTTGLFIYYLLTFLLGIFHLYKAPILIALFYVPSILLLLRKLNRTNIQRIWYFPVQLDRSEMILLMLTVTVLFYNFIVSLPPITHYDALVNHLNIPAEYLIRQGLEKIPYNIHANLPPASHMIHLLLLVGVGGESVQTFGLICVLFIALAFSILDFQKNTFGWMYGLLIFILIPQVSLLFSLTNIDFMVSLFCITSVVIVLRILENNSSAYRLLLALHLSFLLSLKYQSIVFVSVLLLFLGSAELKNGKSLKNSLVIIILVVAFSSPILIKNYLFTNNPIFPFVSEAFNISSTQLQDIHGFIEENRGMSRSLNLRGYGKAFLELFTKRPETGLLSLIALLLVASFRRMKYSYKWKILLFIVSPMLILLIFSFNVTNLLRWNQSSLALISLLGGICVAQWVKQKKAFQLVFILYVACSFYLSFMFNMKLTRSFLFGVGKISEDQYRSFAIPSFQLRKTLTGLEGKVLFIGESRGYYNIDNSIIPSAYDYSFLRRYFQAAKNVEDLRNNLLKDNIHYLFINIPEVKKNSIQRHYFWGETPYLELLKKLYVQSVVIGNDGRSVILKL